MRYRSVFPVYQNGKVNKISLDADSCHELHASWPLTSDTDLFIEHNPEHLNRQPLIRQMTVWILHLITSRVTLPY